MTFKDYLKDKYIYIFLIFINFLISSSFMLLININIYIIIFIEMLFIFTLLLIAILDFLKRKSFYNDFINTLSSIEEKSYITEIIKKPNFFEGEILYDSLKIESKYINDIILNYNVHFKEYRQYIETWVHEVKTPIATSKLLIENNKNIITLSIDEEINKIDNYIEQVLYLAKSDNVEKDYIIKKLLIKNLVLETIKKKSKEIINKGIRPIMHDLDYYVLSDSKWIEFILGQIISNSIKYTNSNPVIEFYCEKVDNKINLFIKDNGIGIPPEDLERVFLKGFGGNNGRNKSESTGMGLYICKKLCTKLDVGISVIPDIDKGTIIKLTFLEAF